jgi:hypothetical protein
MAPLEKFVQTAKTKTMQKILKSANVKYLNIINALIFSGFPLDLIEEG